MILVRPLVLCSLLSACQHAYSVEIVLQDSRANPVAQAQAYWIHDGYAEKLTPQNNSIMVPGDTGVLVISAEGYQHNGLVLGNSANDDSRSERLITMRRLGESGGKRYQSRTYPLDPKLKARLQSVVESKCWAQVKAKQLTNLAPYAFQFLGHMVPRELTAYLDNNSVDQNAAGMGRQAAIRRLASVDPTAALEQLDAFKDSMRKSMMISGLLSSLPASSPIADTLELQFADATRTIDQPALRLASWAVLAEYYIHKGKEDKAQTIIQRNLADVRKLPAGGWSGFPRSLFAALIVNDQPDVARQLVQGIDDNEKARAIGRLAFYARDPKLVSELLGELDKGRVIGYPYSTRVLCELAKGFPEAAIENVKTIGEAKHRAWALGLIAKQISSSHPDLARKALVAAQTEIDSANAARLKTFISPGEILAGLLPIAEELSPASVDEMIWQSVWSALPHTRWSDGGETFSMRMTGVAAAVARYDAELASALARAVGPVIQVSGQFGAKDAINSIVLQEPESLVAFVEELPFTGPNVRGVEAIAKAVVASQEEFWEMVSQPRFLQYPNGKFEER
ncbi:MAG TPA: hypothetical protein DDW52_02480 [Planctomycetaceae bacterium]|nr:hypothetical protein [Planctomycetaceae bacterium]